METPFGLIVEGYDYSGIAADAFHDWYDGEHIPQVTRVGGILNAQRWLNAEEVSLMPGLGGEMPKVAIATYDVETPGVLESPAYRKLVASPPPWSRRVIGLTRRVCYFEAEQILPGRRAAPPDAGGMMLFAMNLPAEVEDEFNAWFNDEHIPRLSAVPGVLCARRFRMSSGTRRYLVLYHLSSAQVQSSEAWTKAGASPWTTKMQSHFLARERNPFRLALRRYEP